MAVSAGEQGAGQEMPSKDRPACTDLESKTSTAIATRSTRTATTTASATALLRGSPFETDPAANTTPEPSCGTAPAMSLGLSFL